MDGHRIELTLLVVACLGASFLITAPAAAQTAIDWSGVSGNGVYNGTTAGVGWTLTVTNADSVMPDAGDSTLLRGRVGNPNASATYQLVFSQPVNITWHNDASGSVGGLSGVITSNERVDLVGGVGHFTLRDYSSSIATPPSSALPPILTTSAGDLVATAQPNQEHAYYEGKSRLPRTSITWRHRNNIPKAEVWRVKIQPCLIDWTGVNGNGTYSGSTAGVNWRLTVSNADNVTAHATDPTMLHGSVGMPNSLATYELHFDRAVDVSWWNDADGTVGGLRGTFGWDEFVEIQGGVSQFTLAASSVPILTPPAGVIAPSITPGPPHLRASWVSGQDHAYYIARSIRPQTTLRWTHGAQDPEDELWRICVEGCDLIEWDNVDIGGGAGTVGNISWTLHVTGADAVSQIGSDPTLLRGRVGSPNSLATYTLGFSPAAYVIWANGVAGSIGGLAGAGGSNEMVDIVAGLNLFTLTNFSANIFSAPAGLWSPLFSVAPTTDLRAERQPGLDHAYYEGKSLAPTASLTWEHMNNIAKNEVWWVCASCEGPSVARPVVKIEKANDVFRARWSSVPSADSYDVVYGNLSLLRETGGSFADAVQGCLSPDETGTIADLSDDTLGDGEVRFYLVRSRHCDGNGTFDITLSSQVSSRDPGIEATGVCP